MYAIVRFVLRHFILSFIASQSYPMPNRAMARRMAALQMCIDLHRENEIDDNLLPIGKENFKAKPEDAEVPALPDESRADFSKATLDTIKRRQYYYEKVSAIFFFSNLSFFSVRLNNTSTSYEYLYLLKNSISDS